MLLLTRPARALGASLVLLTALAGCSGGGGGSSSSSSTPSASKTASSPSSSPSKGGRATITISDFTFKPSKLTVAPGAKVTVVNEDSATHTVTATDKDKSFDTGDIAGGEKATFTAPSTAGSYSYECTIHPFMKATLTVK
ncbi:MAG TPA: cupredoxin domain-containing protein [Streptomyces sp.]|nr:cupredoxin domain-containing protein [Streptomyces sp.]